MINWLLKGHREQVSMLQFKWKEDITKNLYMHFKHIKISTVTLIRSMKHRKTIHDYLKVVSNWGF